ncbi:MAG: hypothetical protein F6K36_15910 [Symploca sp. SIO3C6]|uniref:Uncharacterized protein n=1 Tax=Symploca sp. SIO1C4 TaxID=2607765 RepID=A0A6B3N9C9_9CYAN|nr:hypothetical protein [Symploca sp. SIO3C6]NER27495.1 hypothetical protein [Symploca sp. SIO1C4]
MKFDPYSKRRQPGKFQNRASSRRKAQKVVLLIYLSVVFSISIGGILLLSNAQNVTIGGVPVPILFSFWQDKTARNAYFNGHGKKLHDRLGQMGIEERMKDYYRTQISDEAQLDQHIHQILYNRTGYVGEAYKVNSRGVLVLKNPENSL